MKPFLLVLALFFSFSSWSQSLTGKWKPVRVAMDTLFSGDIKADTFWINKAALKENLKDDKDPQGSLQMMEMVFELLFNNTKKLSEEYAADGTYKEINTITGRTKTGTFTYDKATKTLVKKLPPANEAQNFVVSWKNELLVLTTELISGNGKKGKMEVVYEK